MVTAAQKFELTEWFKPENYGVLKGITIHQLCQEFRLRRAMFDELEEALESDEAEWGVSQANQSERNLILSGNPLLSQSVDINSVEEYESDQHVRVMSAGRLYQFERRIRETKLIEYKDTDPTSAIYNQKAFNKPVVSYVKKQIQDRFDTNGTLFSEEEQKRFIARTGSIIPLEIDISVSTDEQIIESMRYLLNRWRRHTGVKAKAMDQNYGFGEVMVLKLIDFRIIPILDLLYHAKHYGYKLSDKDLEQLLYRWGREEMRDQVQIKETDRPLAKKALTRGFDNLFTMFLYKNRHLMDMKISVLIEMHEEKDKKKTK